MVFVENKDGPFYLSKDYCSHRKYDILTGEVKVKEKSKSKKSLMEELKKKGFYVKRYYTKEEIIKKNSKIISPSA